MVRRSVSIRSKLKSDGDCNLVREYLLHAWNAVPLNANKICQYVLEEYSCNFKKNTDMIVVVLVKFDNWSYNKDVHLLCDTFYSYDISSVVQDGHEQQVVNPILAENQHNSHVMIVARKELLTHVAKEQADAIRRRLLKEQVCRGWSWQRGCQ